jgi:hypothetical protein
LLAKGKQRQLPQPIQLMRTMLIALHNVLPNSPGQRIKSSSQSLMVVLSVNPISATSSDFHIPDPSVPMTTALASRIRTPLHLHAIVADISLSDVHDASLLIFCYLQLVVNECFLLYFDIIKFGFSNMPGFMFPLKWRGDFGLL